jgi:hypothetical protein
MLSRSGIIFIINNNNYEGSFGIEPVDTPLYV